MNFETLVTYIHSEGNCTFELELEVNHRKSVYFLCPKCKWLSEFVAKTNPDSDDTFAINSFKIVDDDIRDLINKQGKKKKISRTPKRGEGVTKRKPRVEKLSVGKTVFNFSYKTKLKIKELTDKTKRNETDREM